MGCWVSVGEEEEADWDELDITSLVGRWTCCGRTFGWEVHLPLVSCDTGTRLRHIEGVCDGFANQVGGDARPAALRAGFGQSYCFWCSPEDTAVSFLFRGSNGTGRSLRLG